MTGAGSFTTGGVLVPLNTRYTAGEATDILARTGAPLLFASGEFLGADKAASIDRDTLPELRHIVRVPIETDDGQLTTAVSRIDWKASAAAAIEPGQFQQFAISAGPLPDVASVAFPTTQRYSDGTVVEWNQLASGSAEPEHPAPVLTLAAKDAGGASTAQAAPAASDTGTATAALAVAIAAVVAALAALVVAVIGLLRGTRRTSA